MNSPAPPPRWQYAALGLPLAMVALPVYVQVPQLYGDTLGMPLAWLGLILFLTRLVDTVQDPWLGRLSDRLSTTPTGRWRWLTAAALVAGVLLLFNPPDIAALLPIWLTVALLVVYSSYSLLQIDYLAWGGAISDDPARLAQYSGAREAAGVVGVVLASALPSVLALHLPVATAWLVFSLAMGTLLLAGCAVAFRAGRRPPAPEQQPASFSAQIRAVWGLAAFRRLAGLYAVNCLANALPATLVLFYISDVLRLPGWSAVFLVVYFGAALAGMPLWLFLTRRIGLVRTWQLSLLAAILAFCWVPLLGPGAGVGYGVVCLLAGLALGGDLALPPALLAGQLEVAGIRDTGPFYGWWTLLAKGSLALSAGIALPLLDVAGYRPGSSDNTLALIVLYAGLPCLIKLVAALRLGRLSRTAQRPFKETVHEHPA